MVKMITGCTFLWFNGIYFKLKWGEMARKCLEMLCMTAEAKFKLP